MDLISIAKPPLFNFEECKWFLDRGYDDCMHQVLETSIRKLIPTPEGNCLIEVADGDEALEAVIITGPESPAAVTAVRQYLSSWFDMERDLNPLYDLTHQTKTSWLTDPYQGLRLVMIPDFFEAISWSVIGQQINLKFAFALKRRLVELCSTPHEYEGVEHYTFPSPASVAKLTVAELKERQYSQRKAEYLIGIAQQFEAGLLSHEQISGLPDTPQMIEALCAIRGIGEWSANYVLMKAFQRMDCITHGDTGLQAAVKRQLNLDRKPTREEIIEFLKPFKGWESYLVFYLWRTLSDKKT